MASTPNYGPDMADPRSVRRRRGTPVITRVLEAALDEIARVGAESLSVERVAARAEVNRTSIWRRWPTPEMLALSAIDHASDTAGLPNTGSLRGDLIEYLQRLREVCRSSAMRSLLQLRIRGTDESLLGRALHARFTAADQEALSMYCRAVERGELPVAADLPLLRDVVFGAAQYIILQGDRELDDDTIDRLVTSFLDGAVPSSS